MIQLDVRTLLVVDDEEMILESLMEFLTPLGISVIRASSPEEALAILEKTKVTAILSDIRMPGYSGIDFLERLRGMGNNVPFVFLTASFERANIHRALQLGAIDFLEKPFDCDHLQEVVFKVLEIGVRQQEVDNMTRENVAQTGTFHTGLPQSSATSGTLPGPELVAKKNKLINLLRIKLPWQKAK